MGFLEAGAAVPFIKINIYRERIVGVPDRISESSPNRSVLREEDKVETGL